MNKKNKILVGCLALLLVLSVGYALFSDTITINGTATAKGDFDITTTCQTGVASGLESGFMGGNTDWQTIKKEGGYKNDACSIIDDDITLKVDFDYPGARRYFTVKFTNNGSITAKIPNEPIYKTANSCVDMDEDGTFSSNECEVSTRLLNNDGVAALQVAEGSIVPYNAITNDVAKEFLDAQGNRILKPGNSVYYVFEFGANEQYGDAASIFTNGYFMVSTDFTLEFPFEQITN